MMLNIMIIIIYIKIFLVISKILMANQEETKKIKKLKFLNLRKIHQKEKIKIIKKKTFLLKRKK